MLKNDIDISKTCNQKLMKLFYKLNECLNIENKNSEICSNINNDL